jgi:hypothetical protein
MNLNLNGNPLTTEELLGFAATTGCNMEGLHNELTALHSTNMTRSHLMFVTRGARFEAWTEGKLLFRTQLHDHNFTEKVVCREIFDFLVATIKETS